MFHIKDTNGNLLTTECETIDRWREHFHLLLNHPPVPPDPHLAEESNNNSIPNPACRVDPVTEAEVVAAMKKRRNSKAPGICGITAEMLKAGGATIVQWMTRIINHIWVLEELPEDWTRGIILPFWKHKGERLQCANYRGITLLSIPGKLFTRVLLTRALPAIRSRRRPQQAGFMPSRSTIDHISALRLTIEKAREFRKDRRLFIAFVDLKAAFDTVDHGSLWRILKILGAPEKITNLFQCLYGGAESCVRINSKESDNFAINSGVRQGCVAAPDLFNCVVDYILERVCQQVPGVDFGKRSLGDLEYADDAALIAASIHQVRQALVVFSLEARKLGLVVNWGKTGLMFVGDEDGPIPPPLHIDDETIYFVPTFNYLGSLLSYDNKLLPEINRRRGIAASVLKSLHRPLWRHQSISQNTKRRIYNSSVVSVLLYGAETWPLNVTLERRLNGFDSRALRRIEGIHWTDHVPNEELRARTNQSYASVLAGQKRLRWFGHLNRLPPDHPTRIVADFDPAAAGWRRPRGAPRTRWHDVIAADLRQLGLTIADAEHIAQDRLQWRRLVHLFGSTLPASMRIE